MSTHDAHADSHDEHAAHAEGHDHHHHVTPLAVYFAVFGALMVLTAITVWIAQFHFGSATTLIAMLVATVKASLVALIFMHLLYDERLNAVAFGFGLIFVALFFIFTLADVLTRDYIDPVRDNATMQSERVAALRVEYEKQFPVESAFAPVQPGKLIPTDERDRPPAPTEAPEGMQPEGVVPGEDGLVPGQDGMAPAEGEQPIEGAQPEGAQPDGAEPEGAQPEGAEPEGAQPEGAEPEGAQVPPAGAADEGAAAMPAAPGAAPAAAAQPAAAQPAEGDDGEDDEAEQVPGDPTNAREPTRPAQPGGNVPGQQPSQPLNQPPVQEN